MGQPCVIRKAAGNGAGSGRVRGGRGLLLVTAVGPVPGNGVTSSGCSGAAGTAAGTDVDGGRATASGLTGAGWFD